MRIKVKLGRNIYNISEKDTIRVRGNDFKLITQEYFVDNAFTNPRIPQYKMKEWIKIKAIYKSNSDKFFDYYVFDLDKLKDSKILLK